MIQDERLSFDPYFIEFRTNNDIETIIIDVMSVNSDK
jgi:hypothetical protein